MMTFSGNMLGNDHGSHIIFKAKMLLYCYDKKCLPHARFSNAEYMMHDWADGFCSNCLVSNFLFLIPFFGFVFGWMTRILLQKGMMRFEDPLNLVTLNIHCHHYCREEECNLMQDKQRQRKQPFLKLPNKDWNICIITRFLPVCSLLVHYGQSSRNSITRYVYHQKLSFCCQRHFCSLQI